jgi:kinetochore protein Nuf2
MDRVSFPLLSAQDIFAHLRCLDLQVLSEADVLNPRPEAIREIYAEIIEVCLKRPRFEILKPKLEQLKILRITELHERTTELLSLFSNVKRLLDRIGCRDEFKMNDFFKPEFKRHRRFLSAILNFIKFRTEEEEMISAEESLKANSEQTKATYQQVKAEHDRLQMELEGARKRKLEALPAIDDKRLQIEALKRQIGEVNAERGRLEADTGSLQENIEDVKRLVAEVRGLQGELDQLSGSVKPGSSQVDKGVIPLEQLKELLTNVGEGPRTRSEQAAKTRLMEEIKGRLQQGKLVLESYVAAVKRAERVRSELKLLKAKLSDLESQRDSPVTSAEDPSAKLAPLEAQASQLQAQLQAEQSKQSKLKTDLKAGEELLRNLKAEKLRAEADIAEANEEFLASYKELLKKVSSYRSHVVALVEAQGV